MVYDPSLAALAKTYNSGDKMICRKCARLPPRAAKLPEEEVRAHEYSCDRRRSSSKRAKGAAFRSKHGLTQTSLQRAPYAYGQMLERLRSQSHKHTAAVFASNGFATAAATGPTVRVDGRRRPARSPAVVQRPSRRHAEEPRPRSSCSSYSPANACRPTRTSAPRNDPLACAPYNASTTTRAPSRGGRGRSAAFPDDGIVPRPELSRARPRGSASRAAAGP